jgi:hypothetical protein
VLEKLKAAQLSPVGLRGPASTQAKRSSVTKLRSASESREKSPAAGSVTKIRQHTQPNAGRGGATWLRDR